MLHINPVEQHLILLQLYSKFIERQTSRRLLKALTLRTNHLYIVTLTGFPCNSNDELQHVVVQIVRLGETEHQLLLSIIHVVIAVLIVCVG